MRALFPADSGRSGDASSESQGASTLRRPLAMALWLTCPVITQLLFVHQFDVGSPRWWRFKLGGLVAYFCWVGLSYALLCWLRPGYRVLLPFSVLAALLGLVSVVLRTNIDYAVMVALLMTTWREAVEVFLSKPALWSLPLAVPLGMVALYFGYGRSGALLTATRRTAVMGLLSVMGLGGVFAVDRDFLYAAQPLIMPFQLKNVYREWYQFQEGMNKVRYESSEKASGKQVYVLVIGESARRHSMSAYGYAKNTTPHMDQALQAGQCAAAFRATSGGVGTAIAVPLMVSTGNAAQFDSLASKPTLFHVFKAAGFHTILLSNQELSGINNDKQTVMFGVADEKLYISGDSDDRLYDHALLEPLLERLQKAQGPTFVAVHLMGSHADYKIRYPKEFSVFDDPRTGAYDNSIRYTDHLLGQLMGALNRLEMPATLVYSSDHGDNLNDCGDGNWLHAVKEMTPFEIEVPMFWFFNPASCRAHAPEVQRMLGRGAADVSHDNLDKTLLGLAGLKDKRVYDPALDLAAPDFQPQARFAINRRREVVNVDEYLKRFDDKTHCPVRPTR